MIESSHSLSKKDSSFNLSFQMKSPVLTEAKQAV